MCSTPAQRIAEIGRAIDDLAVKAGPPALSGPPAQADPAASDTGPIVARLAELWALLAELDPEVGRRLAGYQNLSALTDLLRTHHPESTRRPWPSPTASDHPDWRLGPALPVAG